VLDSKALHVLQISQGTQRKHQQREQQSEQAAFTVKSGRMSARQDHSDEHESRTNGKVYKWLLQTLC
jgi:hypothetical protein